MAKERPGAVVGVDVGGTFTDLVELDQTTGRVRLAKVPSTPENQAFGVLHALKAAESDLAALDLIVHGTTRNECLMRLRRALEESVIEGVETTLPLHRWLVGEPDFINGAYDIRWLEQLLADQAKGQV